TEEGAPSAWMIYYTVPDADATTQAVQNAGGTVRVAPMDLEDWGRMAQFTDPLGGQFAVWQPGKNSGFELADEPGSLSWTELYTTDADVARKFYSEVFGWQPSETMDMGPMGKYHMFNRPHGMIGGMMNKPPEMAQVPPNWQIYFRVPDINAAVERIKANGGQILNGPMEVPGGDWVVNAMDPQGAAFGLHAKKAQ
ncbi:MAG TPA: VOC family protein, partial [Vicinamibacterales bacterium]|nr:VOC family protein [Vicinamibacterales bacterium]